MNTCKRVMCIVGILLVAAFVLMLIIPQTDDEAALKFEPMDAQFALLDRAHEQWFGQTVDVNDEVGVRVRCEWYLYKSLAAQSESDPENAMYTEQWQKNRQQLEADIQDFVAMKSLSGVYWASEAAFDDLVAVYEGDETRSQAVVDMCKDVTPTLEQVLSKEVEAFKQIAMQESWLDQSTGKLIPESRKIASLLHRKMWFETVGAVLPLSLLASPEEQMTVFRWQVEQSAMPLHSKLAKLQQFEAIDVNYDFDYARAVLLERDGMPHEACLALKSGQNKEQNTNEFRAKRYRDGLEQLQKKYPDACSEPVK